MAIYNKGTASLASTGIVTGSGTDWLASLSMIRKGNTIIFANGVYATIDTIISATSLRVSDAAGATAPSGKYTILITDALSVDGLAQSIAETLRYWQSTVDGINTTLASAWSKSKLLSGNLNVLYEEGVYFQNTNSGASTENNYPVPTAGALMILKNGANSDNSCTQIYIEYYYGNQYRRTYQAATNTWTPWKMYAMQGETRDDKDLAPNEYSTDRLSISPAGSHTYLRRFRCGSGESIFHETVKSGDYCIYSGVTPTIECFKVSLAGASNITGYVGGNKIITADMSNASLGSGALVQNPKGVQSYTLFTIKNNFKDDSTATLSFELPWNENLRGYLVQRPLVGAVNQVVNNLPASSGVIAIQGTSGIEFKRDIKDASSLEPMGRIMSLELKNFIYKDDEKNRVRFGFIAEQAENVAPQYVKHNQEMYDEIVTTSVNDDGEEVESVEKLFRDRPSIDINPIVMDLIGCIHNLQDQINELKEALKSKK